MRGPEHPRAGGGGGHRHGLTGTIEWVGSKPDRTPKKHPDVSRLATLAGHARIPLGECLASTVSLFREDLA